MLARIYLESSSKFS